MSPTADRLATLASALGRRFSVDELAQMARMPIAELLDPIKELVQADIFIESGDRLAFGHDLIREAVRASSPVPVRRALDRQAADVLLARGALPVEVAQQLADSAEPGDETAIATLLQAADALGSTRPGHCRRARRAGTGAGACAASAPRSPRREARGFPVRRGPRARRPGDSPLRRCGRCSPPRKRPGSGSASPACSTCLLTCAPTTPARRWRCPDLTADPRALLWASLFHNLVVAGRTEEALAIEGKAREAVYSSRNHACWFAFELPESAVHYQTLRLRPWP